MSYRLLFLLLCAFSLIVFNVEPKCHSIGGVPTGTVLFSPNDVHKQCWSAEEIAILSARLVMEDLLPEVEILIIDNNQFIIDLIEYFKEVIETIRKNIQGRRRHILLVALTDILGGYLHHAVLPIARKAFYTGLIDYSSMEKLIELYEELKWFLRTNGQGWAKAMESVRDFDPMIINFPESKRNKSCCHKLIYYLHEPIKIKTKRRDERNDGKDHKEECNIYFPLPFFDSKVHPSAIVVPFKQYGLRNIESKKASYLIMKYFVAAHQCMDYMRAKAEGIRKFQDTLYTWIMRQVIPKLKDDKFYSAFGGILRVTETLKSLGATLESTASTCGPAEEGEEEVGAIPAQGKSSKRSAIILMSMLVVIFAWFIIGTIFICYRIHKNKKGGSKGGKSSDGSTSTSVWSSLWSSKCSSKGKSSETCTCCASSLDRSTATSNNTTGSSEYESERSKRGKSVRYSTRSTGVSPSTPAIIDTKQSMKILPSIEELSENTSYMQENKGPYRKISFADDGSQVSSSDIDRSNYNDSSRKRVCAPRGSRNAIPCPRYDKIISSTRLSANELGTQISELDVEDCMCQYTEDTVGDNTSNAISSVSTEKRKVTIPSSGGDTTTEDPTGGFTVSSARAEIDYHMCTCHSSLNGKYECEVHSGKPYIFGYDFHTSSSSDLSDEDTDGRTSTTK